MENIERTYTREEVQQIVNGYIKIIQNQEDMIQKLSKQIDKDNIQFEKNTQILNEISKTMERMNK